jgi:CRISPR/Cas system-associated protein Csm6
MKKVITTVGTSIFSNNPEGAIPELVRRLKNKSASEDWDEKVSRIEELKEATWKVIKKINNPKVCAEVQSLEKIRKNLKGEIVIHLLATDTILSRLAAEMIQKWYGEKFQDIEVKFSSQPNTDVIKGLQVQSLYLFRTEGFPNLIKRVRKLANDGNYWGDIVFNLTGGYKGIIPVMTTIAQVEGVQCFYIFQEENENNPDLIEIPPVPLEVKTDVFTKYFNDFNKVTSDLYEPSNFSSEFLSDNEVKKLTFEEDGFLYLNDFCVILWEKFLNDHFVYFTPDEIQEEISTQPNIQRILSSKLCHEEVRHGSSVEVKRSHRHVFDDGKNGNRIYFFELDSRVYIYKTFDSNHDAHIKYLNSVDFDEQMKKAIVASSSLRLSKINR